ncbi:MAG: mechanosensitive ion channel family protein [Patescibacteria group bacterium]|nr:mechanosensitive ion channel family protein [Patescibacteria group bacterium]
MDNQQNFLQVEFLGNIIQDFLIAIFAFFVFLIILKLFQTIILKKLKKLALKTKTDIDDTLIEIVNTLKPPFYSFLAFYFALQFLTLSEIASKVLYIALLVWVIYQIMIAVQILINYIVRKKMGDEEDEATKSAAQMLSGVFKVILWVVGFLFILSNLGVNVSSLIAGMGIGGIAVALALQNILGDLFSSFSIYFDKPFKVGDFIVLGDKMGSVKKIGIKTTRIQTPQGEELVVSNSELTKSQIRNFGVMEKRRNLHHIGVSYSTSPEKLKNIPKMIKEIIEKQENAEYSRVHFNSFGDYSLTFQIVYYILSGDYTVFMDTQQSINLKIIEKFNQEGIEIAFPTQTILLEKKAGE